MNTHSHSADGRMEVLCAAAIRSGADLECAREILACNTTDEALHVLDRYHILQKAMEDVTRHIQVLSGIIVLISRSFWVQ